MLFKNEKERTETLAALSAANCTGVIPVTSGLSNTPEAPLRNNSFTVLYDPLIAAQCNGVHCFFVFQF